MREQKTDGYEAPSVEEIDTEGLPIDTAAGISQPIG